MDEGFSLIFHLYLCPGSLPTAHRALSFDSLLRHPHTLPLWRGLHSQRPHDNVPFPLQEGLFSSRTWSHGQSHTISNTTSTSSKSVFNLNLLLVKSQTSLKFSSSGLVYFYSREAMAKWSQPFMPLDMSKLGIHAESLPNTTGRNSGAPYLLLLLFLLYTAW